MMGPVDFSQSDTKGTEEGRWAGDTHTSRYEEGGKRKREGRERRWRWWWEEK
jgi:hypothetical protein